MSKRIKYQVGDIFLIKFEGGLNGVGKVIKRNFSTVFIILCKIRPFNNSSELDFNQLTKDIVLDMTWCYDSYLKKGIWQIVGNVPVEEDIEMPYFYTKDSLNGKYYLKKGGDTYEGEEKWIGVNKEDVKNISTYGIAFEDAIPYV